MRLDDELDREAKAFLNNLNYDRNWLKKHNLERKLYRKEKNQLNAAKLQWAREYDPDT
jgi:hypothetical protein